MKFCERLAIKRKELNLNKKEVAKMMGLGPMYYARFENGQLLPTKANAQMFSDFLGIEKDELIDLLEKEKEFYRKNNAL